MKYDVLEPLNHYIKNEFNITDFEPSLLKAFQLNSKIYGLPKDFSTLALFYNKNAFKEVALTRPPSTWQALREYAKKLTIDRNRDGKIDQYGFGLAPELSRQYFMLKAFGGSLVDKNGYAAFASPDSLKGLQLVIDQYRRERTSALPSDVGASTGSEIFGQGKAAMVIEGTWAIPYIKETFPNIDLATNEVPTVNGKKATMTYTVAYVMNKKAKHKDAAWQLISYLTSKEGMKNWAGEGLVLPARQSVLNDLRSTQQPLYTPFVAGANYGTIWQAGENLPTISTHFNNQFISALIGEQSLISAMQKAEYAAKQEIKAAN